LLFVGLTGGIGAGKSEALAALERLGAAVLSSDVLVHELLAGEELRSLLAARWGENVLSGGEVDRAAVAEIVFEQPQELDWLERELFPRVGERIAAWRGELERRPGGPDVAVVEVPLLFEAGVEGGFDATVAVVADERIRGERAAGRDHQGLAGRQSRQLSQDEKATRADHVVRNDGSLADLERALAALLDKLRAEKAAT
jgi:dephospho-CoA kinase